jgi:phosphate transport system substrate-binding protein
MAPRRTMLLIGLLTAALFGASPLAAGETLRIGGTGAVTEMLPQVFAAFNAGDGIELEVIPGLGTGGGLRALSDGVLDIAASGRALKPEEMAQGMVKLVTISTPFVLVTSHPRPNGFKSSEIADVFFSEKAAWADGTLIRIILRPKGDTDTAVLGGMFPRMAEAIEAARQRLGVPVAATDTDNADAAERVAGSLAAASFTQIQMERRNLRLVAIDGVEPSLETWESGAYPYAKTIHFILPAKKSPAAERFVAFLKSPAGQAALRAAGSSLKPD